MEDAGANVFSITPIEAAPYPRCIVWCKYEAEPIDEMPGAIDKLIGAQNNSLP